ncbi:serine/arginine-rich splicing factor SR45 [Cebus imitator]|uniref:serine/arginine-rich splicing factor SR45 n=1 Tax=Cebus imitator TaxID=2715852 RepID=UPI00080A1B53|nr:serine/arginine-rich splicing factor SR45 [Cebus imitator]
METFGSTCSNIRPFNNHMLQLSAWETIGVQPGRGGVEVHALAGVGLAPGRGHHRSDRPGRGSRGRQRARSGPRRSPRRPRCPAPRRADPPSPRSDAPAPRRGRSRRVLRLPKCRQSPRSHGQPFRQRRSHGQAPRQGRPAQEGGGRRPSRGEEAAAGAGGGRRGARGRGGRAAAGPGGDRHPDRWRRQSGEIYCPCHTAWSRVRTTSLKTHPSSPVPRTFCKTLFRQVRLQAKSRKLLEELMQVELTVSLIRLSIQISKQTAIPAWK